MAEPTKPPGTREQERVLGLGSATGVCIASMIGMGIFTVTGVVGPSLVTDTNVLLVWIIAGGLAFCGAISVAEIGAMRPCASSQYVFIHEALGPIFGYLNGMATVVVGYLAAIAVIAIIAGAYLQGVFPSIDSKITATAILLTMAIVHGTTVVGGTWLNNLLVILKIGLVLFFILAGLLMTAEPYVIDPSLLDAVKVERPDLALASMPTGLDAAEQLAFLRNVQGPPPLSSAMAIAVVVVGFAYLGWSNSCDVGGEVKKPKRNLPASIIASVGIVTLLYLIINIAYLRYVPPAAMLELLPNGDIESMANLGAVVAEQLFGEIAGNLIALAIFALLVSTLSTVTMTCGRVLSAMSWKGELPMVIGRLNRRGAPTAAIAIQSIIAIPIVWIAGLSALLDYIGILVTIMVSLTMISIFVMRRRKPNEERPYRIPLFPIPPLVYIAATIWIIISAALRDPLPLLASLGTLVLFLALRPLLRVSAENSGAPE